MAQDNTDFKRNAKLVSMDHAVRLATYLRTDNEPNRIDVVKKAEEIYKFLIDIDDKTN